MILTQQQEDKDHSGKDWMSRTQYAAPQKNCFLKKDILKHQVFFSFLFSIYRSSYFLESVKQRMMLSVWSDCHSQPQAEMIILVEAFPSSAD